MSCNRFVLIKLTACGILIFSLGCKPSTPNYATDRNLATPDSNQALLPNHLWLSYDPDMAKGRVSAPDFSHLKPMTPPAPPPVDEPPVESDAAIPQEPEQPVELPMADPPPAEPETSSPAEDEARS